jgi:hypothetical protein
MHIYIYIYVPAMAPLAEALDQSRHDEMGGTADPTNAPINRYTYLFIYNTDGGQRCQNPHTCSLCVQSPRHMIWYTCVPCVC